jgi:hypothetical protein
VERFERKFYILPAKTGFAYTLLRQVCRPDREFPKDTVNSLYFDTADLDQYERSEAGDYRKDKVRIRWYGTPTGGGEGVPVYLDLKMRRGFASSKIRKKLPTSGASLEPCNLRQGIISTILLKDTLAEFGFFPERPLRPVIVIRYERCRFNEIMSGVRVSFDCNIRATVVASELGCREREIRLPGGVIEVKGPSLDLPVTLRRMSLLDTDWSRFSKYGSCLDAHFSQPGSFARCSPPGRIVDE